MSEKCTQCDQEFSSIGHHWRQSSCEYPALTNEEKEIITGLMMGDGWLESPSDRNPRFRVAMINKTFLKHYDDVMGVKTTGVSLKNDASGQARSARKSGLDENAKEESYSNIYCVNSRNLPLFAQYEDWYKGNGVTFPPEVNLTPMVAKYWYISDGSVHWCNGKGRIRITSENEMENEDKILSMFIDKGFDVSYSGINITMDLETSRNFLNWMGDALPGFEYKWEINSHEKHMEMKEEEQ